MEINKLIKRLNEASGPERGIDNHLAILIGYRRESVNDPDAGVVVKWFNPIGEEIKVVPAFTKSIECAMSLAEHLLGSGQVGAFLLTAEGASASFDQGRPVIGASPPIAICLAAIEAAVITKKLGV